MSDPAISAARKVFTEYWPDQGDFEFNYSNEGRFGIEVAREMAKSVQELHKSARELAEGDVAEYEDTTLKAQWVSGWTVTE